MIQEKIYSTYQWINTWLPGTKKYYYFHKTKLIEEISLNIFDHYILRKVFGCYKKTHLSTVLKKVYRASLGIDEKPLKSNHTYEEKSVAFMPYEYLNNEYKNRMKNLFYKANELYLNNKNREKFIDVFTFNNNYTVAMHYETVNNGEKIVRGQRRVTQVTDNFFISTVQFKITHKGAKGVEEDVSTKISMSKFTGYTAFLQISENNLKKSPLIDWITRIVNTIMKYTDEIPMVSYPESYEENEKVIVQNRRGQSVEVDAESARNKELDKAMWHAIKITNSTKNSTVFLMKKNEDNPVIDKPISLNFIYPLMTFTKT